MLRIIGDAHGKIARPNGYIDIANQATYSVQLGDLGYGECIKDLADFVNPSRHKVVLGNHDDYSNRVPHALMDYGIYTLGGVTFGYIRGENSVDKQWRTPGLDWWPQEEMNVERMNQCLDFFANAGEVDVMISHGCPHFIIDEVSAYPGRFVPSQTSMLLTAVHDSCKIGEWYFGHHHNSWQQHVNGTYFRCLAELEHVDIQ